MLRLAMLFAVLSTIAGVFGLTDLANRARTACPDELFLAGLGAAFAELELTRRR